MSVFDLDAIGRGLPAASLVPRLADCCVPGPLRAVIEAPPGTGKTTVVPPAVANLVPGRVVVTQPRRVAARAAADRLSDLSGERVGLAVRGEHRRGDRVEFATTGVLLRRLLNDPELSGIGAVVMDEVHERALESDLVFAMLRQLADLRDDLSLVVMSATVDAQMWADLLGEPSTPAPVLSAPAQLYDLKHSWAPGPAALGVRGVERDFLDHVARIAADHAHEVAHDILVFLPGRREIARVESALASLTDAEVLTLTGSTPAREQRRITSGGGDRQRIVLATNVAESSLTVPGVRTVVDAGLDRQVRLDSVRGMSGLVTVGAAKDSMVQRAGRAARQGPGTVIRCMAEADFAARPAHAPAEITTADLTQTALDLACWGAPRGEGLALPTPPPEPALDQAEAVLNRLGALEAGQPTDLGRRLAAVPADPRLARALFDGADFIGGTAAAQAAAALVSDVRSPGGALWQGYRAVREDADFRREVERFASLVEAEAGPNLDEAGLAFVTALAFPERIARAVDESTYKLASGTAGELPRDSALRGHEWLAIADIRRAGSRSVIGAAVPIDFEQAQLAADSLLGEDDIAQFDGRSVRARRVRRFGAIELSSTPVQANTETARRAIEEAISARGLADVLPLSEQAEALRRRMALLHRELGEPWPDVSFEALSDDPAWLAGEISAVAAGGKPDMERALTGLLPWPEAARLDELAPERIQVPSGSRHRVHYPDGDEPPVLAVKLQECFGWEASPRIVDGRVSVLLHLLSPAGRPLAITADLESFWNGAYSDVRAENRGKYRKHPWPEDPWNHVATAKTTRRLK
ncbi:ATP-dependent helicase HrpB [Brevibacterium sp. HMSC063G07]|uniref:ATP-dependent helicase HrpB n=1 Tax=Brevibacterium sp. HMSC063G07 TaxID=1739261 RepID=UPI0008A370CD|nr:ATP-dependent helicase HrpB [Brevibacterium sp. HMSC063G07]OFL65489.1 hypothetical protein HMPREF2757_04020 [Brevibacterium sp. HMSC063G07]